MDFSPFAFRNVLFKILTLSAAANASVVAAAVIRRRRPSRSSFSVEAGEVWSNCVAAAVAVGNAAAAQANLEPALGREAFSKLEPQPRSGG